MLQSVARFAPVLAALALVVAPTAASAADWEYGLPTNWRFDYFGDFGSVDYPDQSDYSSLYAELTVGGRYQLGLSPDWALTFGGDASWQLPTDLSEAEGRELGSVTAWGLRGFAGVNFADMLELGFGLVGRDVTGGTWDVGDPLWGGGGMLTSPAVRAGVHFGDSEVALFATGIFTLGGAEEGEAQYSESLFRAGLLFDNLGGGFAVHDWTYAPGPESGGRALGGAGISLFFMARFDTGPSRGRYPVGRTVRQPTTTVPSDRRDASDSAKDLYKKARRHLERGEYEAAGTATQAFLAAAPPDSAAGRRYLPKLVEAAREAAEAQLERGEYQAAASAFAPVVPAGSPLVKRQAADLAEKTVAAALTHVEQGDPVDQAAAAAALSGDLYEVAGQAQQQDLVDRLDALCSKKAMEFMEARRPGEARMAAEVFHVAVRREVPKPDDRYVGPLGQRAYEVLQASLADGDYLAAYQSYRLFDFMKPPVSSLGPERLAIATGLVEQDELLLGDLQEVIRLLDLAKPELAEAGVWRAELSRAHAEFRIARLAFVDHMAEPFDGPQAAKALHQARTARKLMGAAASHVKRSEERVKGVDETLGRMEAEFATAKAELTRAQQARYAAAKARADVLSAMAAAKEGVRLYEAGDYWSAAPFLEKAAAAESADGLLYLGRLYSRSAVWPRDCKKADALFQQAKARGARSDRCSAHQDAWRFW